MFDAEVNMEINITINERITDLRTMSGLSQKELADRIDVPTSTLCRIEQGKIANVSNDVLIKLANFFNVSTDYLLGLTNVKFKKNVKEHPENRMEISHDIRQLNAEKIGGDEADLNKLRNIFMSILKDIKVDYGIMPQDIGSTEFQEMLAAIKTQSDDIQAKRPVTETDIANITASLLSGVDALDETETMMFYELSKHLLERMSRGCD